MSSMSHLSRHCIRLAEVSSFKTPQKVPVVCHPHRLTQHLRYLQVRMAASSVAPKAPSKPLTTEQFMDLLCSTPPSELASLRRLHMAAYPLPLWSSDESGGYVTHDLEDLLPLFPGLALDHLEVEDAFHGPEVAEDGWGHNATYNLLGSMIKRSRGWKELEYRSQSDTWLEPVVFTTSTPEGEGEDVHGRDPQPETWDRLIKSRDGEHSGAGVEMWYKPAGEDSDWEKVVDGYQPNTADHEVRPAIQVRVRRGEGADYKQDGKIYDDRDDFRLDKIFKEKSWAEIKKTLLLDGMDDPCAHL